MLKVLTIEKHYLDKEFDILEFFRRKSGNVCKKVSTNATAPPIDQPTTAPSTLAITDTAAKR